jgi:hypothetical protein
MTRPSIKEYPTIPIKKELLDTCSPPPVDAGLQKTDACFLEKKRGIRVFP